MGIIKEIRRNVKITEDQIDEDGKVLIIIQPSEDNYLVSPIKCRPVLMENAVKPVFNINLDGKFFTDNSPRNLLLIIEVVERYSEYKKSFATSSAVREAEEAQEEAVDAINKNESDEDKTVGDEGEGEGEEKVEENLNSKNLSGMIEIGNNVFIANPENSSLLKCVYNDYSVFITNEEEEVRDGDAAADNEKEEVNEEDSVNDKFSVGSNPEDGEINKEEEEIEKDIFTNEVNNEQEGKVEDEHVDGKVEHEDKVEDEGAIREHEHEQEGAVREHEHECENEGAVREQEDEEIIKQRGKRDLEVILISFKNSSEDENAPSSLLMQERILLVDDKDTLVNFDPSLLSEGDTPSYVVKDGSCFTEQAALANSEYSGVVSFRLVSGKSLENVLDESALNAIGNAAAVAEKDEAANDLFCGFC